YAGIRDDLCYDHLLGLRWARFSDQSLASFTARMYQAVLDQQALMHDRARQVLVRMATEDWLGSYARLGDVHRALDDMARRLAPGSPRGGAVEELEGDYRSFEQDFLQFMPEVITFATAESRGLITPA